MVASPVQREDCRGEFQGKKIFKRSRGNRKPWNRNYGGRHSCVARATAICILHIVESFRSYSTIDWYSTSFPRNQKQQCKNRPQKFTIDIPSINSPRKSMEEYWFLAPMSRLAISSASFKYFFFSETLHDNLPVARAKQLGRSMKKTTSCKKATELPG